MNIVNAVFMNKGANCLFELFMNVFTMMFVNVFTNMIHFSLKTMVNVFMNKFNLNVFMNACS